MVKMMKIQVYDIIPKDRNLITIIVNIVAIAIGVFYEETCMVIFMNYKILVTCFFLFVALEDQSLLMHADLFKFLVCLLL